MPVVPLSSGTAYYIGPVKADDLKEDDHRFINAVSVPRDLLSGLQTFTAALLGFIRFAKSWRLCGNVKTPRLN
jgi:hypothetical protein